MSRLYQFTLPHSQEFPGAIFRAFDTIPITECATAPAVGTTVQEIAEHAHAQGKAHTFANGKIYTDLTVIELTAFCATTFAPQT